jgi:tripartite-type tricarboxylate transporter receptor subunit TctC
MGGQIDAAMASYTSLAPLARAGKLRLLGITNPARMAAAPDVPTVAEALRGYSARGWFGFLAPAKTPRSIVLRLNEQINEVMKLPEMTERMNAAGLVIVTEPPEAFGELIRSEHAKYAKLTGDIGFKPQ